MPHDPAIFTMPDCSPEAAQRPDTHLRGERLRVRSSRSNAMRRARSENPSISSATVRAADQAHPTGNEFLEFGPFRLRAMERLLEKDGRPLALGSRALDILIALVERATEVVSKRDLLARAWPGLVVNEGSLRFHITALRKVLGDGQSGARYVSNVPGRGYCFVAPVSRKVIEAVTDDRASDRPFGLPARPSHMVGRDLAVQEVCDRLRCHRFVSLVGSGGIGKTTVASSVAHEMCPEFGGAVYFIDLGALSDPLLALPALAHALGLAAGPETALQDLLRSIRDRRLLLVLDSCEHIIKDIAALAALIFREAAQLHILATSRESLRVEGEQVIDLPPLPVPPDTPALKAVEALSFPAVRLFADRAAARGHPLELTDADAPVVAEICRRLDGLALALELTAARVGVHGIRGTAALLDSPFRLFWQDEAGGPPRHQTLSAALDWSYNRLAPFERLTLRRLSVFCGAFALDAIQMISAVNADRVQLAEALASLVEKCLVTSDASATQKRYRLLETTRTYLLLKLTESGERSSIARRHAIYYADFLARTNASAPFLLGKELFAFHEEHGRDVRAALQWSFSEQGDVVIGTALAASWIPLFSRLSEHPAQPYVAALGE